MVTRFRRFKIPLFLLILSGTGYFYALEFKKNWTALQNFRPALNVFDLTLALLIILLAYLLETLAWKVAVNGHGEPHKINLAESVAIVNTSGLLKYLPGRVWAYTAQLLWLQKYHVSKSRILHANIVTVLGSTAVSLYLGIAYLWLYTDFLTSRSAVLLSSALVLFNIAYLAWNPFLMNRLLAAAGRILHREVRPVAPSKSGPLLVQLIYLANSMVMCFGVYFLGRGIGLELAPRDVFPILASLSVAWLAGYMVVISPGGLGVREGVMLLMLNHVVNAQTALIFPILSRVIYLVAEAVLGMLAFLIGWKHDIFFSRAKT